MAQGAAGRLVVLWKEWGGQDQLNEHAVTWADVESNITVKEVAAPNKSSWMIYEAARKIDGLRQRGAAGFLPHLRLR